jgi:tRNA A-37 threonylcarbamoyl transferase component Bud32
VAETVDYRSQRATSVAAAEDFPDQVAGYRLVRRLGSGGMGTVFEAEDLAHRERVAVKLIRRDQVFSRDAVDRFRQEGKLASAVTHPRCVFVLAVDEDQGSPYIVMELMPGTTLQSLVETAGPLDSATAILKIFDVIEGLQEFHKRGLIHRDVKPSNCFLENGGRVKIGDFGLSKSLDGGADLTRTGTFIGTPLYASPEQIKRDEVDERTDVYSVAATLYYLVAAQPPVQAKDAVEALARIASEPAPPLRGFCPKIPRALEAVIHRGLERDPARRWRNLQEFHDALAPFVPERFSIAGLGLRAGAYFVDLCLAFLVNWAIFGLSMLYHQSQIVETLRYWEQHGELIGWFERGLWFLYFVVLEGTSGASLGKWLAGLRVNRVDRGGPPGLRLGIARTAVFCAITELPAALLLNSLPPFQGPHMWLTFWAYDWIARGLGLLALSTTMRRATGFRGIHEWLSSTRVVRAVRPLGLRPTYRLAALANSRTAARATMASPETPYRVGPYVVQGTFRREPARKVVLGQDSTLERPVWIVLSQGQSQPPSPARRSLNRRSRPRWIGGGAHQDGRWDAYTPPTGCSLADLVRSGGLPWADVLPLLQQLAAELQSARDDGTLSARLEPEQVWVDHDGGVQLIDVLSESSHDASTGTGVPSSLESTLQGEEPRRDSSASPPSESTIVAFLGEVARLALEGTRQTEHSFVAAHPVDPNSQASSRRRDESASPRSPRSLGRRIRAAVPEHARLILDRLSAVRAPFESLARASAEFESAASRPAQISFARRAVHLGIQAFFLLPGLLIILLFSSAFFQSTLFPWNLAIVVAIPAAWVLWSFTSRGGLSLPLAGIVLVRNDGRDAGRLACALRTLLVWAGPTLLLASSCYVRAMFPEATGLAMSLWLGALGLLICYVALALFLRDRGPHDRLAGTVLVPF